MTELTPPKGCAMTFGIIQHFPGGTKEQYEASVAAVHPGNDLLPAGQIFHVAGPSGDGWTVMAIHETKASWERFRDDILLPRLQAGVHGGFTTVPEEAEVEVYKLLP
jgi:hypothetical protein